MKCTKQKRLSYTEKALQIVNSLTLEEKVSLMSGNISLESMLEDMRDDPDNKHYNYIPYSAGGIEQHNVPPMLFCDGPRGVVCGNGKATCFPVSMLRGATFDIDLEERIGRAIGKEVRAFKGNLFAGVCINLPYNPGWGRSQETYGEESFHLGEMGAALTRGVQKENVIACVKHYAFNQMEISRFKVSVDCDKRTEREVFLPHFKKCIDQGAACVMSSYNLYKGIHCGHHEYLLNRVLKEEWDFDGFIMSDFGWGIRDTAEAANGGQNMEMCCTEFFGEKLVKAVKDGLVDESKIDDAALRIIRTLIAFDEACDRDYDESLLGCREHINLALEAARKGITLIKNDGLLPLDKAAVRRIVVLGKQGRNEVIGDHGSSQVRSSYVIVPIKGLANVSPKSEVVYYNGEDLDHAKELAQSADAVVFVVGCDHDDEGEYVAVEPDNSYTGSVGGDRQYSLGLHQDEIELIQTVGPVNKNSVAVMVGGNMIMMEEWKDSVNAIIMAYYAGMEGGTAIAEIIYGDVNPSGKLPYVVPMKESDLPQVNWDSENQWYEYYHGYARLEKAGIAPSVPYGYGLSYTSFEIKNAKFTKADAAVIASCEVTNTGERSGDEVIQLYVGFQNSGVDRPVKLLRGFKRISLEKDETQKVDISCPTEELCWFNEETGRMELEHMEYEMYIGTSSASKDLVRGSVML